MHAGRISDSQDLGGCGDAAWLLEGSARIGTKLLANGLGSLRAVAGRQHAIISGDEAVGANIGRRHITVQYGKIEEKRIIPRK